MEMVWYEWAHLIISKNRLFLHCQGKGQILWQSWAPCSDVAHPSLQKTHLYLPAHINAEAAWHHLSPGHMPGLQSGASRGGHHPLVHTDHINSCQHSSHLFQHHSCSNGPCSRNTGNPTQNVVHKLFRYMGYNPLGKKKKKGDIA